MVKEMKKMPTEKFMNLGDYKKQAILDAMRAEFMTTPYSEIRISSLIKRAGISRASFYLYFQSKEDLFTCMMHQLRERLVQGLVEAFQEQKSSFDASMSRLVNRIMDDEIYRDCWEFCKAGGWRMGPAERWQPAQSRNMTKKTCGKRQKKNVMRPWIIPDIQG